MAVTRPVRAKVAIPEAATPEVMGNQNRHAGDSRAVRTERISWATTPEMARAVEEAAWQRHTCKSHLIEEAVRAYLGM